MRTILFTFAILAGLLGTGGNLTSAPNIIVFYGDSYASVAYSESTGRYGYSYGHGSRDNADIVARKQCRNGDPKIDDAKTVGWVRNGWVAFAKGDNGAWGVGYSYGDGASNREAKQRALAECQNRGKNARLIFCVCSLDRKPEIFE